MAYPIATHIVSDISVAKPSRANLLHRCRVFSSTRPGRFGRDGSIDKIFIGFPPLASKCLSRVGTLRQKKSLGAVGNPSESNSTGALRQEPFSRRMFAAASCPIQAAPAILVGLSKSLPVLRIGRGPAAHAAGKSTPVTPGSLPRTLPKRAECCCIVSVDVDPLLAPVVELFVFGVSIVDRSWFHGWVAERFKAPVLKFDSPVPSCRVIILKSPEWLAFTRSLKCSPSRPVRAPCYPSSVANSVARVLGMFSARRTHPRPRLTRRLGKRASERGGRVLHALSATSSRRRWGR